MDPVWGEKKLGKARVIDNSEALGLYRQSVQQALIHMPNVTSKEIAKVLSHFCVTDRTTESGILHAFITTTSILCADNIYYKPIQEGRQRITPALNLLQVAPQGNIPLVRNSVVCRFFWKAWNALR